MGNTGNSVIKAQGKKRREVLDLVWSVIQKYCVLRKYTQEELAAKVHCARATISNRSKRIDLLTLDEAIRFKDALDIPDEEFAEAIFGCRFVKLDQIITTDTKALANELIKKMEGDRKNGL